MKGLNQKTLLEAAILSCPCFVLCGALSVAGEIKSVSPLNEQNLETILENRGKFTESDLTKMLGPPSSIEKSEALFVILVRMDWEEVTRIEVKCRDGIVKTVSGTFPPGLPSRIINYSAFQRLRPGMKANDVVREFFTGWPPRVVRDSSEGTVTLVYEQYNRFHIHFSDGEVLSAERVWHTDEHLNTPAK